jgi:general secretion pathway protein D
MSDAFLLLRTETLSEMRRNAERSKIKIAKLTFLGGAVVALSLYGQQPAAQPAAQPPAAQPAAQPPAQTQPALPPPTVPGGLNLNNASLIEVINILAQDLKINYILDPSIKPGTVTINTYGVVRDVDLRPLLETILRMNGLAMVQVGNIFRIVPAANVARLPISPIAETNGSKLPDDERMILNLVFLRYMTSAEMQKVLLPFIGEGAQLTNYDPANLLIVLDNSRNMRRTLDLIAMFDADTFAGQRVQPFEVKNGRPSDIAKELEDIFRAYALSSDKGSGALRFLPINRINTILAVAPNPGAFAEVEKWLQKLDIPAKVTAGSVDNYVYKLKYGRAEVLGAVINQLYGGCGFTTGLLGGLPGNSSYPANGYAGGGAYYGGGGGYGYGGGSYGQGGVTPYGGGGYGGYGGGYGGYGGGYGGGGYPGGGFQGGAGGFGGFGVPCVNPSGSAVGGTAAAPATPFNSQTPTAAGTGTTNTGSATTPTDQTGSYLTAGSPYGRTTGPRIIPNALDNTIIVQGTPQEWEQIQHLLEQIDVAPRQVLIDAKIYEVNLSGAFSLGVESFLQSRTAPNPAGIPGRQAQGSVTTNALGTAQLALSAGTLVGQSRELLALLQASEQTQKAKVLSAPSVIATDSIPASITVGDSVPTLSSIAASNVQQNGNSLFTNTIQNTSTGIGLTIVARINPSGIVTMVINQNVTAPTQTTTSNIDSPSFSQRNVSTQVTVEDGDTIAIGGIIEESNTETSSGIPFLHRLPYVGAAFGTKSTNKTRTELIIFLTPRVIYDTNQIADATDELKQKVRNLRKAIKNE